MDADSWSVRSAWKRYQSSLQSGSEFGGVADMFLGIEDFDAEHDIREEFPCPFCSEYFDILGLCCHIDEEHPLEAKNGVCPVCTMRDEVDIVAHITLQHGNIFKMQRKRKLRKGGSHSSSLSLLRRELREGALPSLLGGSFTSPSSSPAADPLLSSFILPVADGASSAKPHLQIEKNTAPKGLDEHVIECNDQSSPLSIKDRRERETQRQFWTTIHDVNHHWGYWSLQKPLQFWGLGGILIGMS